MGEGWHERAGGPHAEVVALEAAGPSARGSTLYVTMEPCAHHGRTPPCVDAVVAAGVTRVVAASLDPGEDSGGGLEQLRAEGWKSSWSTSSRPGRRTRRGVCG